MRPWLTYAVHRNPSFIPMKFTSRTLWPMDEAQLFVLYFFHIFKISLLFLASA